MAHSKLVKAILAAMAAPASFPYGMPHREEIMVKALFPSWAGKERYDIVIPNLNTIIEAHGIQHYKPQTFGDKSIDPVAKLALQQERDRRKRGIAEDNGWTFLEISYKDEKNITPEWLEQQYQEALANTDTSLLPKPTAPKRRQTNKWEEERKERARAYRKAQYEKQKPRLREQRRKRAQQAKLWRKAQKENKE